mgnify:CR=1 FL=1
METITVTKEQKALIDELRDESRMNDYNAYLCESFCTCTTAMSGCVPKGDDVLSVMNMLDYLYSIIKTFGQTTKA